MLQPRGTYEDVKAKPEAELLKLSALRHPNITYIYDAFEYQDTFYLITERCYGPIAELLRDPDFQGTRWILPIARCLLQAVHYIHLNGVVHLDIHSGNVFTAFAKDELQPDEPGAIQFRLGDLGVAKLVSEIDRVNTLAQWMLPPEIISPHEFGPIDQRIDIYHVGLLLLQIASSTALEFTREEILAGRPRELALALPAPFNFALEKALRRHVPYRTAEAMELWRDLNSRTEPPDVAAPAAKLSASRDPLG